MKSEVVISLFEVQGGYYEIEAQMPDGQKLILKVEGTLEQAKSTYKTVHETIQEMLFELAPTANTYAC